MGCPKCQYKNNVHALSYFQLCETAFSVYSAYMPQCSIKKVVTFSAVLRDREGKKSQFCISSYPFLSNMFTMETDSPYATLIIRVLFAHLSTAQAYFSVSQQGSLLKRYATHRKWTCIPPLIIKSLSGGLLAFDSDITLFDIIQ